MRRNILLPVRERSSGNDKSGRTGPKKVINQYFVDLLMPRDCESYIALLWAAIHHFHRAEKSKSKTEINTVAHNGYYGLPSRLYFPLAKFSQLKIRRSRLERLPPKTRPWIKLCKNGTDIMPTFRNLRPWTGSCIALMRRLRELYPQGHQTQLLLEPKNPPRTKMLSNVKRLTGKGNFTQHWTYIHTSQQIKMGG